jgi:hypothetical protein
MEELLPQRGMILPRLRDTQDVLLKLWAVDCLAVGAIIPARRECTRWEESFPGHTGLYRTVRHIGECAAR